MEQVERLAQEHKPKVIIAGGSGYPRHWDFAKFREIADSVGAIFFVDMAHFRRPGRRWRAPFAVPARPRGHHHHPQDPARAARGGMILTNDEALAKKLNRRSSRVSRAGP